MSVRIGEVAVVVNPVGSDGQRESLRDALDRAGLGVAWLETTEQDPGVGQARRAARRGAAAVIACGGDGTVRACVEGLAGTQTSLAVVPAGTGNLLAKNLQLPEDPAEAIEAVVSGRRRRLDVGYVNGEAFAIMAGSGFDAAIMRDTDGDRKERIGALAYVETALRHLRDDRVGAIVQIDGRSVFDGDVATVVVGNLGRLQGGMDVLPDAAPDDGALDVMVARPDGPLGWLRTAWSVLSRRPRGDLVERWSGSQVDVRLARPTPYQLDGEVRPPATHLEFGVRPLAIAVCVPEEER